MRVQKRLAAYGLVILFTACGPAPVAEPVPAPVPVIRQVSTDVATLVSAVDAFGLDLLTAPTLADEPNLVVSPVSISLALQMVGAGAVGQTAAEIRKVLHLPEGELPQLPDFSQTDVKVSNTAWAQRGLELKPRYRDTLRTGFGTTLNEADFRTDPESARRKINQTVTDQTAGKIRDLFPRGRINRDTRLVVTNALYLKALWAQEFPADRTADAPFTRADGSTVTVPMMHNSPHQEPEVNLGYAEGPGYQVVTLPYKGGRLAFTVIVPATLEAVRDKGIATILSDVQPAPVALAMPRFTARTTLELNRTLKEAGMPTAFSPDADFSDITGDAALHIATVQHKTFVQVDEKGTEAAAATGVGVEESSAPTVHTVTVDRPFLFVITDTATGAPLFLGKITDPTDS